MVLTLTVEHLRFRYGERFPLLEDISFELAVGDVLCLLGPNGSGKTTLLRCLLGVHRLTAGSIQVGGRSLTALTAKELARQVAYVPQRSPAVFPTRPSTSCSWGGVHTSGAWGGQAPPIVIRR
jgi:iron complex transport system ATP-binding protein